MAIGTDRRIGFAPGYQLAVNSLPEIIFYILVASAASGRDIEMVDR